MCPIVLQKKNTEAYLGNKLLHHASWGRVLWTFWRSNLEAIIMNLKATKRKKHTIPGVEQF
jgi:hypothetical protein